MVLLPSGWSLSWLPRRLAAALLVPALIAPIALAGCGDDSPRVLGDVPDVTAAADDTLGAGATVITVDERLTFTDDPATSASAVISATAGGTVSVTAADGTEYTLDVPADAVPVDTLIKATAASSITGISGATAMYGVRFEPEGLNFVGMASLRIRPATPIEDGHVLPFQAAGDGSGAVVGTMDPTDDGIVLLVPHFSLYGIGQIVDHISDVVVQRRAADAGALIWDEMMMSNTVRREIRRLGQDTSRADLDLSRAFIAYMEKVVLPVLKSSSATCTGAWNSAQVTSDYLYYFNLLKPKDVPSPQALAEQAFLMAEKVCEPERTTQCQAAPDHTILEDFWIEMHKWRKRFGFAAKPGDDPSQYKQKSKDICESYAYFFTGGIGQFQVESQLVCDVRKMFVLNGGIAIATFSGSDTLSGSYSSVGDYGHSTSGTYTITLPDGPGKPGQMTAEGSGSNVGGQGGGTHSYTLAPAAEDACQ